MNKTYAYNHQPIEFDFKQTIERFFVEEIPQYKFNNKGANLILKIKKQDMSTFKLVTVIAKATGLEEREIGYAGLKDKSATTIQYISIPKQYERDLIKNLTTDKIKIVEKFYSKFPIKIGQLKSNKFSIVLHKVTKDNAKKIEETALNIAKNGFPNYYGYQRFGEDSKSYIQGQEIASSGKRLKGAKEKLLVSAYQSHLFNNWLSNRLEISKTINENTIEEATKLLNYPLELVKVLKEQPQFFKLFIGDDMLGYPYGKRYYLQEFKQSSNDFNNAKISPTGILSGSRAKKAYSDARALEENFDDDELSSLKGDRRYAWIWAEDLSFSYNHYKEELTINFALPKGSYATTFLEEIAKKSLKERIIL